MVFSIRETGVLIGTRISEALKNIGLDFPSTNTGLIVGWNGSALISKIMPLEIPILSANTTVTNIPAALTELFGQTSRRRTVDLQCYTQFRIAAGLSTAGNAGSKVGLQFSNDAGVTWFGLDNGTVATISTVNQVLTSTGSFVTAWTNLAAGALIADCLIRCVTQDGDGAADPVLGVISAQFR